MKSILILFLAFSLIFPGEAGTGKPDTGRRRARFDPTKFGVLKTLYPEAGRIYSVDVSTDGRFLVCGGADGDVVVVRTRGWSISWRAKFPLGMVTSVSFCPRSNTFAVAGNSSNRIYLLKAEERKEWKILTGEGNPVHDLVWFPDGRRLASAGGDGAVRIWEVETGRIERVLRSHQGAIFSLALKQDGSRLISGGRDGTIRIYDTMVWKEIGEIRNPGMMVKHLQLIRNGKTLYGAMQGRVSSLRIWDVESGKLVENRLMASGKILSGIQLESAERYLVLAVGEDLQVWRRAPLKLVETCKYPRVNIQAMGYSSRPGWVVTGGACSHVTIWGRLSGGMSAVPPRGFFGVRVQDAGNNLGSSVVGVIPDTAAARAGIRVNDIISQVGGYAVRDMATTIAAIGIHSAEAKVSFTILREDKTVNLEVKLGARPEGIDP